MDVSGLVQSYDPRASSSAAMTRAILAPHYVPVSAYGSASMGGLVAQHQQLPQQQQQTHFNYGAYSASLPGGLLPAFTNYIQQRPPNRVELPEHHVARVIYHQSQTERRTFIEERHTQSPIPVIKAEPQWNLPQNPPSLVPANGKTISPVPTNAGDETNFGTEVDTLMKAIQAKAQPAQPQPKSSPIQSRPAVGVPVSSPSPGSTHVFSSSTSSIAKDPKLTEMASQVETHSQRGGKKRYQCTINGCSKSFYQKTHLDIHERAHTGDKPYPCREPGCGRSFSQLGNLKTHERRHTGERPYKCDICDKRFAQRGNVRAHRIVHEQAKPYLCRLDECGKQFTQLGNLKSHQNKFHISTIRTLTSRFESMKEGVIVPAADKEIWEYFANLYKNSNKGIKGRGKDRKVGPNHMSLTTSRRGLSTRTSGGFGITGPGRGNKILDVMGTEMSREDCSQYDMFDGDDDSTPDSSGPSPVGTCYDDAPSDTFEDGGRSADLAFSNRIY